MNNPEWSFLPSTVEYFISGKKTLSRLYSDGAGLHYRVVGFDVELFIELDDEFTYSARNNVSTIDWKLHVDGKFIIYCRKKTAFHFSSALPYSICQFVKVVSNYFPHFLSPRFNSNILMANVTTYSSCTNRSRPSNDTQTTRRRKIARFELLDTKKDVSKDNPEGEILNPLCKSCSDNKSATLKYNFANLPEDLIFNILSMLVEPIQTPESNTSWNSTHSFYKDDLVRCTNLAIVNSRLLNIFRVNLWELKMNQNLCKKSKEITKYKNIGSICISNVYINNSDIREFAYSKNLPICVNKLSISRINTITDCVLSLLILRLKDLDFLEVVDCNLITGNYSFQVIGANSSIRYLRMGSLLEKNESITDHSFDILLDSCNKKGLNKHNCGHFTKLSLLHLEFLNCAKITRISIMKEYCPEIEYLDLRGCRNIPNSELGYFLSHLRSLKVLILSDTNINDYTFGIILNNCKEIEVLDISYCNRISNKAIARIPNRLRLLTGLKLSYCSNIETLTLLQILACCKYLEILDLSGCYKIGFEINRYQVMKFTSNLKKVGAFQIDPNSTMMVHWLCDKVGIRPNGERLDAEIYLHRELEVSEFVLKYTKKRDSYVGRNKLIWMS